MQVGFVGLGSMGGEQARLLAQAPVDLIVYDAFAPALQAFDGKAKRADSLASVGRHAEIVGVCVRDDQQVREVLEGDGGLLASMSAGSVILIHSTIRPDTVVDLAANASRRGVTVIDAPVTRTVMQAGGPFVFTMTGGADEITERVRPVLEVFSTDIIHVGKLGAAMVLKICNNLVTWIELLIARQAFTLAAAGGVSTEKLATVMKRNGALTPSMAAMVEGAKRAQGSEEQRRAFLESQGRIGEKDLELAIELGAALSVPVPTAIHAREFVKNAMLGG
jgi:3-hydroxyisobutyrate dehydrogenase